MLALVVSRSLAITGTGQLIVARRVQRPAEYPVWELKCGHSQSSWGYVTYLGKFWKKPGKYLWCDTCNKEVRVKGSK